MMADEVELLIDYPSKIAQKLLDNEIDIGLVPVAIIPELKKHHIVSDFCIACDGAVASVCLFSEVSIENIEVVLLDYQSRTSVALLKVLLRDHWKISPVLKVGTEGYENCISGTTAGLVIGDRAFNQRKKSTYIYDLGKAWKDLTGMPFVFAAWISNKNLAPDFIERFSAANREGLNHIESVVEDHLLPGFDLNKYYKKNIRFKLDVDKLEVIQLFLNKIKNHG